MYPVFEAMPGDIQADMCAHFRRAGTDANRLDGPHARRYAYSIACAHLKLPHLVFDNYMVSSPNTRGCVCFSLSRVGVGHRLQTRYEQRKLTARARVPARRGRSCGSCTRSRARTRTSSLCTSPPCCTLLSATTRSCLSCFTRATCVSRALRASSTCVATDVPVQVPPNILQCDLPLIKTPPDDLIDTAVGHEQKDKNYMLCNAYSVRLVFVEAAAAWLRILCVD